MGKRIHEPEPRALVLGSGSPRRRELLDDAGYVFRIEVPRVDEKLIDGDAPEAQAQRLALEKGCDVADRADAESCVLAADTLVVIDDRILGQPANAEDAQRMLLSLAGRTHRVLTGYTLLCRATEEQITGLVESRVRMRAVSAEEARAYAGTGEPLDKAGGYAVQGRAESFVEEIDGLRSNVIGLPVEHLVPLLARFGVRPG
jgi:septum formation protein